MAVTDNADFEIDPEEYEWAKYRYGKAFADEALRVARGTRFSLKATVKFMLEQQKYIATKRSRNRTPEEQAAFDEAMK